MAGYSSVLKFSWLIIESVGHWHYSSGVLNCLGLEAQDQDSKGKTKTMRVKTETKTKTVTLKTKTVQNTALQLKLADCNKTYSKIIHSAQNATVEIMA